MNPNSGKIENWDSVYRHSTPASAPLLGAPAGAAAPRPPPAYSGSAPNRACTMLFGAHTPTAPIDEGFPLTAPFEHGDVDVREGSDELVLRKLQAPLTTVQKASSLAIIAAGGIGLLWLTLVQEGQVALVQHYDGRMRVLERGWHLLDTVWTSVRKFHLTEGACRRVARCARAQCVCALPITGSHRPPHPPSP